MTRSLRLLLLLLALPTAAHARFRLEPRHIGVEERPWEFAVAPGMAIPNAAMGDVFKPSFLLQISGEYRLLRYLSAGIEGGYDFGHKFEGEHQRTGPFTSDIHLHVFQLTPFLRLGKDFSWDYRAFRPYAIGGMGLYFDNRTSGTVIQKNTGLRTATAGSRAQGHFGFNVGAGFSFRPTTRWRLGTEVRYHQYFQRDDIDGNGKAQDAIKYIAPTARVYFLF